MYMYVERVEIMYTRQVLLCNFPRRNTLIMLDWERVKTNMHAHGTVKPMSVQVVCDAEWQCQPVVSSSGMRSGPR